MSNAEINNNEVEAQAPNTLQLPLTLRHYELRRRITDCQNLSTCAVFEAWDSTLRRDVLIKHIQNLAESADAVLAEARLVASLKHASFLKVHALELDNDNLYVVMEAVKGIPLAQWIQAHHGNEKLIIEHIYHLAAALKEAQEAGLVHGDLQTANLLVDQSGKIRFLNFSLRPSHEAKEIHQQRNHLGVYQGIPYLAPECFSDSIPNSSSEIFALGVIAYEMLTGALPHAQLSGIALVAAQVQTNSDQWIWPDTISKVVQDLVLRMTPREVKKRLSYSEVMQACQAMRPDDPISISTATLQLGAIQEQLNILDKARQRRRYAAFFLLLVLAGGGVWQLSPHWPQIAKALKPYSESREMEQGIAALARYFQVPIAEHLDKAHDHFERILERSPNNAKAVGYMSLVYMSRYSNEKRDETWMQKAKASAQQAMNLNPNLAVSQIANAQVLQWHHKMDEALAASDIAIKLEPNNLRAWATKARILLEKGEGAAVLQITEEGIKRFTEDRVLLELNGVIHAEMGDLAVAESAFRESIRRQPDSVNAYAYLAKNLDEQGRPEEAMQYLQQGLQIRPNAQLYSAYGKAKFNRGEYTEAAQAFEKAVSPQKGVTGSYYRWLEYGESLMWVPGREAEGRDAFQNSKKLLEIRIARSPDDSFILSHMAFIQARLGELVEAKKTIQKAISINPSTDSIYFHGAAIFELSGDRDGAFKMISAAKKLGLKIPELKNHPIFNELRKDPRYRA